MKSRFACRTLLIGLLLLIFSLALVACQNDQPEPVDTTADTTVAPDDTTVPEPEDTTVPEDETEVEIETFEIFEEIVGDVRVQLYSDSVIRLEKAEDGAFCDDNTIAVTNRENWNGVKVTRTEANGKISLVTDFYTVVIPTDATSPNQVRVLDAAGESLWSARTTATAVTSLPAPGETPKTWAFNDCPRVRVPESGFTEVNEAAANNGFVLEKKAVDYYIFVCNEDTFRLRSDYNRLVGSCEMVTIKTLGLWFSRYYPYKDTELLNLVREYRKRGYPLDYVVVDTDWRQGGSTGYDINTSLFPDMKNFLKKMHDLNVNIAFNDHVREYSGSMLSAEQITWFNQNLTAKMELGLDTWWYDRNWNHFLNSPLDEIHGDMLGQMMYYSIMEKHNALLNRRTVMLSNYYTYVHGTLNLPNYIGTHRYSVQWSGDIQTGVLPTELENLVKVGALTSSAFISSDIGGHFSSPTSELFIRWTQYGALSPIMRYHSSRNDRSPWKYGDVADQVANTYINMRYRLMPLFYTLAQENYADGLPIARRLDFYYPQYKEAAANDQYLLGEDILVAPITSDSVRLLDAAWLTAPDGTPGVEITYYNNNSLSGNPIHTEKASTINFDWGTGSPASGVPADNFSAIIRTTLQVGDNDIHLGTISDDGVRVYVGKSCVIDFWQASDSTLQVNGNFVLKAGQSYEIRVEYYEGGGNARLQLVSVPVVDQTNADLVTSERTVFIPDGTWMDVFSGKTYTGPQTITVTHGLCTSPIFVRLGSITPLAYKSDYADTDQWSRLALDVYVADGQSDTSTLYEDDGASLDYQTGASRETSLSLETANGRTKINISAAKGGYETEWTQREWTVRLHASDVSRVTVNGEAVSFEVIKQDATAAPFASEGASPDGDVVVFTFTADLRSATEIVVE